MVEKSSEQDISDVFGIPQEDRKTEDDSIANELRESESFDERVGELEEDIKDCDKSMELPYEKVPDGASGKVNEEDDQNDQISEEPEGDQVKESVAPVTSCDGLDNISGKWKTQSSDEKYSEFYAEKEKALKILLRNGELNFSKIEKEIKNSFVDSSVRVFDAKVLCERMQNIQKTKDRVTQIQTDINSQFFEWERMVAMLHGVLARTHYERGKQDGIVYIHMQDMEMYFSKLKKLQKSAEMVHKNLDSAYDNLSRQVTIALPQKTIERNVYTSQENISKNNQVQESLDGPDLSEFDDLNIGVSGSTKEKSNNKKCSNPISSGWENVKGKKR